MTNTSTSTLPGFSVRYIPDVRHFDSDSYFVGRVISTYLDTCPYGGYWDTDYIVRYVNDFFNDPDYRSSGSYGLNSIDVVIDWIVSGLIADS